jgi:CheY-like chemotaxis protein
MPEMNGLELAQKISQIHRYQRLPLIMLSALGGNSADLEKSTVNFAAVLSKPVKQSHLYDALVQILDNQPASDQARVAPQDILAPAHQLRILLAEDNPVNQKVAMHMLKRIGYQADIAINGAEVLAKLRVSPYDVVLMDLQMPKVDGMEATRRILAEFPPTRRPQIIAMTANAMEGDREECLRAGMNHYITKPVKIEQLAEVLSCCQPLVNDQQSVNTPQPQIISYAL